MFGDSPVPHPKAIHEYQSGLGRPGRGNAFGLFDMYGGSSEWVWDGSEPYQPGLQVDSVVPPAGRPRIWRGGSAFDHGGGAFWSINSFYRQAVKTYDQRSGFTGFGRVAISIPVPARGERSAFQLAGGHILFTDADVERIAALPAAEQIEEVRMELMKRNPSFDGQLRGTDGPEPRIKEVVIIDLAVCTDSVSDISPVRALTGLQVLHCSGSKSGLGRLADLSPLKGMQLLGLEVARNEKLADLSPLQGMPLNNLSVGSTGVVRIEVVKDMPILGLWIYITPVADLSPLAGKSLRTLHCSGTKLKSLKGLPAAGIETLTCELQQLPDVDDLNRLGVADLRVEGVPNTIDPERLRALGPRLTQINNKPAAEFWKYVKDK